MVDKNTKSLGSFLIDNLLYAVLGLIWYKMIFSVLPNTTYTDSLRVLYLLILICTVIGFMITFRKRRNSVSVAVNILIPFEIYTLIVYFREYRVYYFIVLTLIVLLASRYLYVLFYNLPKRRVDFKRVLKYRLTKGFLGTRTIYAMVSVLLLVPLVFNVIFVNSLYNNSEEAYIGTASDEYTIANKVDELTLFYPEKWSNATGTEKANAMQTVANIEAHYLGLPHELNVQIKCMDQNLVAGYTDASHSIIVNSLYLDLPPDEILEAVAHEAYHAYQHRMVDLYVNVDEELRDLLDLRYISKYKCEFQNYIEASEDDIGYFSQNCEKKAREFSEDAVEDYYYKIDLYGGKHE